MERSTRSKIADIFKKCSNNLSQGLESYLCAYNSTSLFKKFAYIYKPNTDTFDYEELSKLVCFINLIPTTREDTNILPILVNIEGIKFCDKLAYIVLETILYYLIVERHWTISVIGSPESENCSNAVSLSSLAYGNWSLGEISSSNFEKELFKRNKDREEKYKYNREEKHDLSYTRCFINSQTTHSCQCNVSSDIYDFFASCKILKKADQSIIKDISSSIFEIKDNSYEHTHSPYIYDIDVKKVVHGQHSHLKYKSYVAINVAIWDFSSNRLGDAIKKKITIIESPSCPDEIKKHQIGKKELPFEKLIEAKNNHSRYWDHDYSEDDFYALSAFQPGITGRDTPGNTGGAGLSHVLDFLLSYSDEYRCYCISGDTIINLDKKFLNKDEEGWYSFIDDKTSDFVHNKPSNNCITKSCFYYPGTAFFLHLELNGGYNE